MGASGVVARVVSEDHARGAQDLCRELGGGKGSAPLPVEARDEDGRAPRSRSSSNPGSPLLTRGIRGFCFGLEGSWCAAIWSRRSSISFARRSIPAWGPACARPATIADPSPAIPAASDATNPGTLRRSALRRRPPDPPGREICRFRKSSAGLQLLTFSPGLLAEQHRRRRRKRTLETKRKAQLR